MDVEELLAQLVRQGDEPRRLDKEDDQTEQGGPVVSLSPGSIVGSRDLISRRRAVSKYKRRALARPLLELNSSLVVLHSASRSLQPPTAVAGTANRTPPPPTAYPPSLDPLPAATFRAGTQIKQRAARLPPLPPRPRPRLRRARSPDTSPPPNRPLLNPQAPLSLPPTTVTASAHPVSATW